MRNRWSFSYQLCILILLSSLLFFLFTLLSPQLYLSFDIILPLFFWTFFDVGVSKLVLYWWKLFLRLHIGFVFVFNLFSLGLSSLGGNNCLLWLFLGSALSLILFRLMKVCFGLLRHVSSFFRKVFNFWILFNLFAWSLVFIISYLFLLAAHTCQVSFDSRNFTVFFRDDFLGRKIVVRDRWSMPNVGIKQKIHFVSCIHLLRNFNREIGSWIDVIRLLFGLMTLFFMRALFLFLLQFLDVDAKKLGAVLYFFFLKGFVKVELAANMNQNQLIWFLSIDFEQFLINELPDCGGTADFDDSWMRSSFEHSNINFNLIFAGLFDGHQMNNCFLFQR